MNVKLIVMAVVCVLAGPAFAGEAAMELDLQRREGADNHLVPFKKKIDPAKTAIIIIDPWNYHWCMTCTERFGAMTPRLNKVLASARSMGMTVIWAPTEVASQYSGTIQRERMAEAPRLEVPKARTHKVKFTAPVAAKGCECGPGIACPADNGQSAICPLLEIGEDDYIAAGAQEVYSLTKHKGIESVIYMGIATNMCCYFRTEGIRSMYSAGLDVAMARDMTDAFSSYKPGSFTPDDGTNMSVADLETAGIPTLDMVAELTKVGKWDKSWIVEPVRLTPWGTKDRPYLFEESTTVTLTCPLLSDFEIRYTLDGSEPTNASTLYEKPFVLSQTTTVNASAWRGGKKVSLASSGLFVRLGPANPKPDVLLNTLKPASEGYPIWLSQWHPVMDQSFEGKQLTIRQARYDKGVGMRAPSNIRFDLKGEYERFVAEVGVDGNMAYMKKPAYGLLDGGDQGRSSGSLLASHPRIQASVYIDGKLAAQSPVLRFGNAPWRFNVAIPAGARMINLAVSDLGQHHPMNLADWVNAGFVLRKAATQPAVAATPKEDAFLAPVIATPDAPTQPATQPAAEVPWDEPVDADYKHAPKEAMERFDDWKYGMRIYLYVSTQIKAESGAWVLTNHDLAYQEKYHNLYKTFNPTAFDAQQWMDLLKRGGMKYFTFVCKHHDGFALWDTATRVKRRFIYTGPKAGGIEECDLAYSVADTPFKRDIVKELVAAGRKNGMGVGLYFSPWDWYDADFRWSGVDQVPYDPKFSGKSDPEGYARCLARFKGQIAELQAYQPDLLEFDCEPRGIIPKWRTRMVKDWTAMWPDIKPIIKYERTLAPNTLFRERSIGSYGDFFTPEGKIPTNSNAKTECPNIKAWQVIYPAFRQSQQWMLKNLIDVTAKGGNFQVGFCPQADGKFDDTVVKRVEYVGDWLKVNGEAIYSTRPWTYWQDGRDVRYTRSKDSRFVYAISLIWPGNNLVLTKAVAKKGSAITMLGTDRPLKWTQDDKGLTIELPADLQDDTKRPCKQAYVFKMEAQPAAPSAE